VREGVAFAASVGLDPVVEVGEGDAAVPSIRNPSTLSDSPPSYRYPPPGLGEHTDELRAWLATPRD
jgi:crotonobetainyl-CoA:carnitine CoA-transferase CaiB-like acyl-CoA transferase